MSCCTEMSGLARKLALPDDGAGRAVREGGRWLPW